jgi:hypothetical protein
MTDDEKMDALLRRMAAEEYNCPPHIVPREQMWDAIQSGLGTGEAGSGKRREPSEAGQMGLGGSKVVPITHGSRIPRWVYFAVAAVALLAVGIQVGRMIGRPNVPIAHNEPVQRDSLGPDSARVAPRNQVAPDVNPEQFVRSDDGKGKPRPRPEPERFRPASPNDAAVMAYTVAASQHLTEAEAMLTAFKGDLNQGRMDAQISAWGKDLLSNTRLLLDSPAAKDPARRRLLQDLELVLVQIVQLSPNASSRDRDLIKGALTDDQVITRLRTAIPVQKGT